MSDIEDYKFSDKDISSTYAATDESIRIYLSQDGKAVFFNKQDVEAMAKHFGIIE